ncbi:MAG TPA: rhodanese-like domain-containing protein [Gammaproteobacteria bacterium]|nr:rhodanese-like domain-containing protein [Gammaproteobacteria bacterium]
MKNYRQLVEEILPGINELFPWDVSEKLDDKEALLIIDIREPYEYDRLRIHNSINVPRGILESACDYGYEETVPELAAARDQQVVLVCRSGNRSVLAAKVMQEMGYTKVYSMKTGMAGWNDYELPMINNNSQAVSTDEGDEYFVSRVRPDQMPPK